MMTPDLELIMTCLESYGNQISPDSGLWELRIQDTPKARRADLARIIDFLEQIGQRLGFHTCQPSPGTRLITWGEPDGVIKYAFYLVASAVLGYIVSAGIYPPEQCLIVYPGGRAGLIAYKLRTNPRLKQHIDQGWRLVKFRHVHRLAESKTLNRDNLDEELALDPLTQQVSQLIL